MSGSRACAWCRKPIPSTMRSDALCCSVRCRQARHRFVSGVGVAPDVGNDVLRLAYADPPYPGLSKRYYEGHEDFAGEVDHADLIRRLSTYDGWGLSTSARALPMVLPLCPRGVRVAAWVRGERPTRSAGPLNAWEPVIYWGGRRDASRRAGVPLHVVEDLHDASHSTAAAHDASPGGHDASSRAAATGRVAIADASSADPARVAAAGGTRSGAIENASAEYSRRLDVLIYRPGVRLTDPARVVGAKPAVFIRWMFDLLGAEPQDEFTDLFPGSGGVMRAWDVFSGAERSA